MDVDAAMAAAVTAEVVVAAAVVAADVEVVDLVTMARVQGLKAEISASA
jgi:hypothetical protein